MPRCILGFFMYIETTSQTPGDKARLTSPFFTPTTSDGEACARFHYHMVGSTVGRLNVYVKDEDGTVTNPAWTRSSQKSSEWIPAQLPVNPLGKRYQVMMSIVVQQRLGHLVCRKWGIAKKATFFCLLPFING